MVGILRHRTPAKCSHLDRFSLDSEVKYNNNNNNRSARNNILYEKN